jgi:hypothetical protein
MLCPVCKPYGLFAHAFFYFFLGILERIMTAALAHGVDSIKSFGYGSIALLVLSLKNTLEFVNLGVSFDWRLLHLLISTLLTTGTLFQESKPRIQKIV